MAQRRMFSKRITNTDIFLEMPKSAQALYFHLNMEADDDGFIAKANTIRRMIGASEDDLKILIAKRFIIPFESGVMVITHWRIHNLIRKDTYQPTLYQEEKKMIESDLPNYQKKLPKNVDGTLTESQQSVNNPLTQDRIGKDRIDKDSYIGEQGSPHYQEIIDYLNSKLGSQYSAKSKDSQKHIRARLKEGYKLEDFKHVIDVKCAEWAHDSRMASYLRPKTLFGTKFESYLNQKLPSHLQKEHKIDERLGF